MARVWIPTRLQTLTGNRKQVEVSGASVRQIIDALEAQYPGTKLKLYDNKRDALTRGMAVTVDGITSELGILEKVGEESEVHFLPAISGG